MKRVLEYQQPSFITISNLGYPVIDKDALQRQFEQQLAQLEMRLNLKQLENEKEGN